MGLSNPLVFLSLTLTMISLCNFGDAFVSTTPSAHETNPFNGNKTCLRSTVAIEKKHLHFVWTVNNFQEYYNANEKYGLEKTLKQNTSVSGGVDLEATFLVRRVAGTTTPQLISTLKVTLPGSSLPSSRDYGADLVICSHKGNFTASPPTKISKEPRLMFDWDEISAYDFHRISDHEMAFVYTLTEFQFSEGGDAIGGGGKECPDLGNWIKPEIPHSEFKHG